MDHVTSYVEISNLSEAEISSGQQGSTHGATIGGAIDLKRNRTGLKYNGWQLDANIGFETNGNRRILGSKANYSTEKFFLDTDVLFRDAENYEAGGNRKIQFSQFRKLNFSGTTGLAIDNHKLVEASLIYDRATGVGYPALPMDVFLAEAFIGSLKYEATQISEILRNWETKLYFNFITHIMDDSQRPEVPIRMDMPRWSNTYGMYSTLKASYKDHHLQLNLNGFYNKSLAEMTMHPNDPFQWPMFMYSWGDIRTLYTGISVKDHFYLNDYSSLEFNLSVGRHQNSVGNDEGLRSLQIFYPEIERRNSKFLGSLASNFGFEKSNFSLGAGLGYGERAPSVSEGYGFYLFNSFDRFDYIGNPHMDNETSLEANAFFNFKLKNFNSRISTSYFHIMNYIVGDPDENISPMTIGADGVKVYTALDYATMANADLNISKKITSNWNWNGQLVYGFGRDNEGGNLPFVRPLCYSSALVFSRNKIQAQLEVKGNTTHTNFSPNYGENHTPAYAILNWSGKYNFKFGTGRLTTALGVENIFDTYYTTFVDWNDIPRRGRNFFVHLTFEM